MQTFFIYAAAWGGRFKFWCSVVYLVYTFCRGACRKETGMKKFDTVIFDLDGTLIDTLPDLLTALNLALAEAGYPTRLLSEMPAFVSRGLRSMVKSALPESCDSESFERVFAAFGGYYAQHLMDETAPYSGILPLLQRLKAEGFKLAVVSNKADALMQKICSRFFDGVVDFALGERENIPRKPAPDGVLLALQTLGADAARTVYVGDSAVDMQTAQNSGLQSIAVSWGYCERAALAAAGAGVICGSIAELETALLSAKA